MITSGAAPDPKDPNYMLVYDEYGQVIRRELSAAARRKGVTDTQLSVEPPNWLKIQFHVFKRFFELVLPGYESYALDAAEGGGRELSLTLKMDSPRNYIWFTTIGVRNFSHNVATEMPLTLVRVLRVNFKRPGAFTMDSPAVFAHQKITHYGAQLSAKKGYVIPAEFVGNIEAPICPFCLQPLVLSNLLKQNADGGSKIERHLWVCRLCSSPEQVPTGIVGSVARGIKDDESRKALPEHEPGIIDIPNVSDSGGDSISQESPDQPNSPEL